MQDWLAHTWALYWSKDEVSPCLQYAEALYIVLTGLSIIQGGPTYLPPAGLNWVFACLVPWGLAGRENSNLFTDCSWSRLSYTIPTAVAFNLWLIRFYILLEYHNVLQDSGYISFYISYCLFWSVTSITSGWRCRHLAHDKSLTEGFVSLSWMQVRLSLQVKTLHLARFMEAAIVFPYSYHISKIWATMSVMLMLHFIFCESHLDYCI
jgi:hypothetical protein